MINKEMLKTALGDSVRHLCLKWDAELIVEQIMGEELELHDYIEYLATGVDEAEEFEFDDEMLEDFFKKFGKPENLTEDDSDEI